MTSPHNFKVKFSKNSLDLQSRTKSSGKNPIPLPLYQCCCLRAISVPANALYIIFNTDNGGREGGVEKFFLL